MKDEDSKSPLDESTDAHKETALDIKILDEYQARKVPPKDDN